MKTCQAHCRACGKHFHGDNAFDRHRCFLDEDGEPLNPQPKSGMDWSTRGCAHPESVGLWSVPGQCRISFDRTMGECLVWQESEPGSWARGGRAVSASDAEKAI